MSTTAVFEASWAPKVTLTLDDDGGLEAVLEVEGLEPDRGTTAEERSVGITSLDPPTVRVKSKRRRALVHRNLISACCRAVGVAVVNTTDDADERAMGPGGLMMLHMRVSFAVRASLRMLGEDI